MIPKKKHIYFIPGMAANSQIFERIYLNPDLFEVHFTHWMLPLNYQESMESYVKRFSEQIHHEKPVLVGVSFGGVIAQELSKIIDTEKIIIVSSLKSTEELSRDLKIIKKLKLFKLFPSYLIGSIEKLALKLYKTKYHNKIETYKKFLSVRSPLYLRWAIKNLLYWNSNSQTPVIHIHGDHDNILPLKYIKNPIVVKKGTHAMILSKAREISTLIEQKLTDF